MFLAIAKKRRLQTEPPLLHRILIPRLTTVTACRIPAHHATSPPSLSHRSNPPSSFSHPRKSSLWRCPPPCRLFSALLHSGDRPSSSRKHYLPRSESSP